MRLVQHACSVQSERVSTPKSQSRDRVRLTEETHGRFGVRLVDDQLEVARRVRIDAARKMINMSDTTGNRLGRTTSFLQDEWKTGMSVDQGFKEDGSKRIHPPSSADHWILSVPGLNEIIMVVSRYLKSAEVAQRARYLGSRRDVGRDTLQSGEGHREDAYLGSAATNTAARSSSWLDRVSV
jgi:hypothetical protein